jgi:5-methylcytosine-specific restriction endonuclease McrA
MISFDLSFVIVTENAVTTKICKRCESTFPATLEFFTPSNGGKSLDIYCRTCRKEYARAWYQKNREKETARSARWNKENPQKTAANMRRCRAQRPDHFRDYMRQYRKDNRDKYSISDKAKHAKRRSAIGKTEHKLTRMEYEVARKAARGRCFYCREKRRLTLDHIIPLSKGGLHSRDNVVFACVSCNSSKGAKDPIRFAQSKGLLLA